MTVKLYDENSYLTEFCATVVSCTPCEKGYEVILDKTIFFPEEGGQCCDSGDLNGVAVDYVSLCGNDVVHYTKEPFEVGKTVNGKIDFSKRFRNMQNHSGEHIICGIAHKLYGCENVGFHLGADYVTMDLDGELTREQIDLVERLANEAVVKNVPVTAFYPSEEELSSIDYRSKSDISGKIRIVNIEGVDSCACCAPHVKTTGEIGLIKILDAIHYKGGMRLNILCGFDALSDYGKRYEINVKLSNMLSSPQEDVVSSVERLMGEIESLKLKLSEKSKELASLKLDSLCETSENILLFEKDIDANMMRTLSNGAKKKTKKLAAVFSGDDESGYKYIISSENIPLKSLSLQMNSALSGRGGGTDEMVQGRVSSTKEEIEKYFKNI